MPVSHDLRCVFVHIPKTGGTSIEVALSMRPADKQEHAELLFGPVLSGELRRLDLGTGYLQHLTWAEIERVDHGKALANYYSFAIVRNPWDRLVSSFSYPDKHMRRKARTQGIELDGLDFETYVRAVGALDHAHLCPQADYVIDANGRLNIDFLGRFETLAESFLKICQRLGIERSLPVEKRSRGRAPGGYCSYYSAETRDIVATRYARDIETFHYAF